LAKYLFIVAGEDNPGLDIHHIPAFLRHLLERVDWQNDLHFQTCTTMDTLDYTGPRLNEGSKLVVAAVGPVRRQLSARLPDNLFLPDGFHTPRVCLPGILAVQTSPYRSSPKGDMPEEVKRFCEAYKTDVGIPGFALVVLVDDSSFAAKNLDNFLWVTFTRSNPAADVHGIGAFAWQKHWGCTGPLVIDARIKPHHAPPLEEDPTVTRQVEALGSPGGPLHGII
jgi:4-hydroxy-3-polyprenylbenzoate decarboxylase